MGALASGAPQVFAAPGFVASVCAGAGAVAWRALRPGGAKAFAARAGLYNAEIRYIYEKQLLIKDSRVRFVMFVRISPRTPLGTSYGEAYEVAPDVRVPGAVLRPFPKVIS